MKLVAATYGMDCVVCMCLLCYVRSCLLGIAGQWFYLLTSRNGIEIKKGVEIKKGIETENGIDPKKYSVICTVRPLRIRPRRLRLFQSLISFLVTVTADAPSIIRWCPHLRQLLIVQRRQLVRARRRVDITAGGKTVQQVGGRGNELGIDLLEHHQYTQVNMVE